MPKEQGAGTCGNQKRYLGRKLLPKAADGGTQQRRTYFEGQKETGRGGRRRLPGHQGQQDTWSRPRPAVRGLGEQPDVPLLPKHPLHQGFHGPWAKKA